MRYHYNDELSFSLEVEKGVSVTFTMPDEISNWQLERLSAVGGDVLYTCSDFANTLFAGVRAVVIDSISAADAKQKGMQLLAELVGSPFSTGLSKGVGELLKYAGEHELFRKLTAILFLKEDETWLSKSEFEERMLWFQVVPPTQLFSAIRGFFQKKTKSKMNSNSPSPISATKKKKSTA